MATKQGAQKRKRSIASQAPRRVSRACDRCRSRKYKCDGTHPCSNCSDAEEPCIYGSNLRKRGLVEGYVRGLERLLGLAVSSDPNFEPLVTSVMNNHLDRNVPVNTPVGGWAIDKQGETMLESWRRCNTSQIIRDLIPALESLDADASWRKPSDAVHDGEGPVETFDKSSGPIMGLTDVDGNTYVEPLHPEDMDYGSQALVDLGTANALPGPSTKEQPPHAQSTEEPGGGDCPSRNPTRQFQEEFLSSFLRLGRAETEHLTPSAAVPQALPDGAIQLLDSYFRLSHCWFPILERHTMQRLSYQYGQRCHSMSATSEGSGEVAALWAILAYELSFQSRETNRDASRENFHPTSCLKDAYDVARSLIPSEESLLELGHVQALLLLALCNARRARWRIAWLLVGQAIRIGIDMGLNTSQGGQSSSRNLHVFLGCFALETFLSARLEKVPLLRGDSLRHLLEEDGVDEWEPWRAATHDQSGPCFIISTFNSIIKAMTVLNDFLCLTGVDSEAEAGLGSCQARLSTVIEESRDGSPLGAAECPMPHQALLHLTLISVSTLIQSRARFNRSAPSDLPDTRLIPLLSRCCRAFGPQRLPPLAEYSGYIVLESLNALPSTPNVLEVWSNLYSFALGGSGKAFCQIQERLQGQRIALQNEAEPRLHRISNASKQGRRSPMSGIEVTMARKDDQTSILTHNLNISRTGNESGTGLYSPAEARSSSMAGTQNMPLERTDLRSLASMPLAYSPGSTSKTLGVELAAASRQPVIDLPMQADDDMTLSDGDTVFDSLALLDATQWSVNWGDQLAEFGFADNTAFKEFCNDNERVTDQ